MVLTLESILGSSCLFRGFGKGYAQFEYLTVGTGQALLQVLLIGCQSLFKVGQCCGLLLDQGIAFDTVLYFKTGFIQ